MNMNKLTTYWNRNTTYTKTEHYIKYDKLVEIMNGLKFIDKIDKSLTYVVLDNNFPVSLGRKFDINMNSNKYDAIIIDNAFYMDLLGIMEAIEEKSLFFFSFLLKKNEDLFKNIFYHNPGTFKTNYLYLNCESTSRLQFFSLDLTKPIIVSKDIDISTVDILDDESFDRIESYLNSSDDELKKLGNSMLCRYNVKNNKFRICCLLSLSGDRTSKILRFVRDSITAELGSNDFNIYTVLKMYINSNNDTKIFKYLSEYYRYRDDYILPYFKVDLNNDNR